MSRFQPNPSSQSPSDAQPASGPGVTRPLRQRTRGLVVAALLLGVGLSLSGCQQLRARSLIRQGNSLFEHQHYHRALKLYLAAEGLDPNQIMIQKFIAYCNMALYEPGSQQPQDVAYANEAIVRFKRYLAVRPNDEKAAKLLVTLFMDTNRLDDAITYFKQYATTHADDDQAVQTIAMLYAKEGDFNRTVRWQQKRIAILQARISRGGSGVEKATHSLAESYYTLGVTCWQKSYDSPGTALDPARRATILSLGMDSLNAALRIRPDYADAMAYVNLVYRQMAEYEKNPARKQALTADADDWLHRALAARAAKQKKERLEVAKKNPLGAM